MSCVYPFDSCFVVRGVRVRSARILIISLKYHECHHITHSYHRITHSYHYTLKNYDSYHSLMSSNVTKYLTRASRSNTGTGDPRDEKTLQLLCRHALEPPMNALSPTLRYGCMKLWSVAKSLSLENVKNVDPDEKWVCKDICFAKLWIESSSPIEKDGCPKIVSEVWERTLKRSKISSFRSGLLIKEKQKREKCTQEIASVREKYDKETFNVNRARLTFVSELAEVRVCSQLSHSNPVTRSYHKKSTRLSTLEHQYSNTNTRTPILEH